MPTTYEPIATTTLGSNQSSLTFSSIPSTYTDLRIVVYWKLDVSYYPSIRINNNSSSVYSFTTLIGNGVSASSARDNDKTEGRLTVGKTTSPYNPAFITFDILSYRSSTNKTILASNSNDRNGTDADGPGIVSRDVILCRDTNPITSVTLRGDSVFTPNNLAAGTIATLYGIKNA